MMQRYVVTLLMCVEWLLLVSARGNVGLTEVKPDNELKLAERLRVAISIPQAAPNLREVFVSGPIANGVVVSATLVLSNSKGGKLLKVPICISEQPDPANKPARWWLSCSIEHDLALGATINILLDMPKENVGTVYRVGVGDFLQPADGKH